MLFGPGDGFYARGNWTSGTSVYGVFREGAVYQDPETREVLGFEAREVGLARVTDRQNDLCTMEVLDVKQDVRIGDRLLPTEDLPSGRTGSDRRRGDHDRDGRRDTGRPP